MPAAVTVPFRMHPTSSGWLLLVILILTIPPLTCHKPLSVVPPEVKESVNRFGWSNVDRAHRELSVLGELVGTDDSGGGRLGDGRRPH